MIAHAHHQKLNGTTQQVLAHAQLTRMEIIVFLVHHQDNGTSKKIHVFAQHPLLNGTELNVFALQENTDLIVWSALLQDTGMIKLTNVSAIIHLSGMVKIVSVHNLISFIKEDAQNVQMDINGNKIVVKNVIVPTRIYKLSNLKLENMSEKNGNDHLSFFGFFNILSLNLNLTN